MLPQFLRNSVAAAAALAVLTTSATARADGEIVWPRIFKGLYEGAPMDLYTGGSDYSAPAFVDLDGDNDLDLVVGRADGMPAYYRNDGTIRAPEWTFVPEGLQLPPLPGASYTAPAFGDMDGDGDLDLVLGFGNLIDGRLAYYRNDAADGGKPEWALISQDWTSPRTVPGTARPALVDVDLDGVLDVIIGRRDGRLTRFRTVLDLDGDPILEWQIDQYSDIDARPVGLPESQAAPFFSDLDGDGVPDLLVGNSGAEDEVFDSPVARVYHYKGLRDSQGFLLFDPTPVSRTYAGILAPGQSVPTMADIDNDGNLDLFVGSEKGDIIQRRNIGTPAKPVWVGDTQERDFWLGLDEGSESLPAFGDLDGDGDLDMLLGVTDSRVVGGYAVRRYENAGAPWLPDWRLVDAQIAGIADWSPAPALADIDADGDLDLFVGTYFGAVRLYRNEGGPKTFEPATDPITVLPLTTSTFSAQPAFADMDRDGDLDMWVGCQIIDELEYFGSVLYYRNDGSPTEPVWAEPEDWGGAFAVYDAINPRLGVSDLDGDGLFDMVLAQATGEVLVFPGIQTAQPFAFGSAVTFVREDVEPYPAPALADLDGDLHPEMILGGSSGGLQVYGNPAPDLVIEPNHVTVLSGETTVFDAGGLDGAWEMAASVSGGFIDPDTGEYSAGDGPARDTVRFVAADTGEWGTAHVNVVTAESAAGAGKAIVLAGRKESDPLWSTTNELAHAMYNMLLLRGYPKANVRYLNPEPGQDVDGNGAQDDIYAASSPAALEEAVTTWASDASSLFVYLVDHGEADAQTGGEGFVRCNGSEVVYGEQVGAWLDELQAYDNVPTVTLVVDCCQSGSFLRPCAGTPETATAAVRVVIASCGSTQPAFFSGGGLISFSNLLTGTLASGFTVGGAFQTAADGMDRYQQPALDDDGDGVYSPGLDGAVADRIDLGAAANAGADRPQIAAISDNQNVSEDSSIVTVWASGITGPYSVARVWATVTSPGTLPEADDTPAEPVLDLAETTMLWNDDADRYEVDLDGFNELGAWLVNVYAEDIWGNVSFPKQMQVGRTDGDQRMIIVCGDGDFDADSPWSSSDYLAQWAFDSAKVRWLTNDDITYLSSGADPGVDGSPTRETLQSAIASVADATQLTIYMVGRGSSSAFDIAGDGWNSNDVTPSDLGLWLTEVESAAPDCRIVVLLEFTGSGAWLPDLRPGAERERVVISCCDSGEAAWCESGGVLSFSQWFFSRIRAGASVGSACEQARSAIRAVTGETQNPLLDDDGSGSANTLDGTLAAHTYIGAAFVPGGETPWIGTYARDVVLSGSEATLWANDIHAQAGISRVYAQVVEPGATATTGTRTIDLLYADANTRWEAALTGLDPNSTYRIAYHVEDNNGVASDPHRTVFGPAAGEDIYDRLFQDDTEESLNFFTNGDLSQAHNFAGDDAADWALFNVDAGGLYSVNITDVAAGANPAVSLFYEHDLVDPAASRDDGGPGDGELLSWFSGGYTGTMLVRVAAGDTEPESEDLLTSYTLAVTGDWGANAGLGKLSSVVVRAIGPSGGTLDLESASSELRAPTKVAAAAGDRALQEEPAYVYTRHAFEFPPGCLDTFHLFTLQAAQDLGNNPVYPWTIAWLDEHPGNASIVQVLTDEGITLNAPVQITVEFVNDGPVLDDVFLIDDIPTGQEPASMRIFAWNGSSWDLVPGVQTAGANSVTASITSLGTGLFAAAPDPEAVPQAGTGNAWMLYE